MLYNNLNNHKLVKKGDECGFFYLSDQSLSDSYRKYNQSFWQTQTDEYTSS
jgi:hypothetical protein